MKKRDEATVYTHRRNGDHLAEVRCHSRTEQRDTTSGIWAEIEREVRESGWLFHLWNDNKTTSLSPNIKGTGTWLAGFQRQIGMGFQQIHDCRAATPEEATRIALKAAQAPYSRKEE